MARRQPRLESAGNAETHSQYRDVCVLIPRPSRPLFIGFRCRILRQTSSHRTPPSHAVFLSLFSSLFFSLVSCRVASRSPSGAFIFSPLRVSFSDPFTLNASVNLFTKICRASNKFKQYAYRVNRVNAIEHYHDFPFSTALSFFRLMID